MTHPRSWGIVWGIVLALAYSPALLAQQAEPGQALPEASAQPAVAPPPGQSPPNAVYAPGQPSDGAAVPSGAEEPPPPAINLHPEPPLAPPVRRTDRVHDGFYVRINLGFGALAATVDTPGSLEDPEADGDTLSGDLAIGFAPSPGIVLGGALFLESLPSADFDGQVVTESNVGNALVGVFFDGYPRPRGGFHLGGAAGFDQGRLSRKEVAGFKKAYGYGIAGWIGYDAWVADDWAIGGLVRLMGTRTGADADATELYEAGSANLATESIQFMVTALYN